MPPAAIRISSPRFDPASASAAAREAYPDAYASSWESVRAAAGILVPGGFGDRGVEGKIAAIKHARETGVPFLGICLGMQCAVIEVRRRRRGGDGSRCPPCQSLR